MIYLFSSFATTHKHTLFNISLGKPFEAKIIKSIKIIMMNLNLKFEVRNLAFIFLLSQFHFLIIIQIFRENIFIKIL